MPEFDEDRTYKVGKFKWALCDPRGAPVSLHPDPTLALAAWARARDMKPIVTEWDRQRLFKALTSEGYCIAPTEAWCRVKTANKIEVLIRDFSVPWNSRIKPKKRSKG